MNYYDKHIGDYIRDTVGLTMIEDGAYNRLIDQLYQTERALPLDKKEIYRMARANSALERKAVDYVVAKFFFITDEGYMQKRAQIIIEDSWDREPANESKRENAKIRQQRTRERRKSMFDQLRDLGVTPAFNASMKTLEAELSRVTKQGKSQPGHATVTRDDTLTQSPLPNTQYKDLKPPPISNSVGERDVTDAAVKIGRNVEIAVLLRSLGVQTTAEHPLVCLAWAEDPAVTDEVLRVAVATAKESKPTERIPANYLKGIVERHAHPPEPRKPKAGMSYQTATEKAKTWTDQLLGNRNEQRHEFIDITPTAGELD